MATHSSVLARRIPETGSLLGGGLWGRTELDTTVSDLAAAAADGVTYPFQDSRDHYKVFLNVYKRYIALD